MELEKKRNDIWIEWKNLSSITSIITSATNHAGLLAFLLVDNINLTYLLCVSSALTRFLGALTQSITFFTGLGSNLTNYESYLHLWKGKDFVEKYRNIKIPGEIKVTEINIKRGDFSLKGGEMTIKKGGLYLIKGKTASGKTSFLQGLTGTIKGIKLDENQPQNYYHGMSIFYQNVKEKLPTNNITIRKLFNDEKNDEIILKCFEIAGAKEWADKLTYFPSQELKVNSVYEYIIEFVRMIILKQKVTSDKPQTSPIISNKYDMKINCRYSGGEKSRLAISLRIYEVLKNKKEILILDEFEQGSDPDIAYDIINRIVVSHLEKIQDVIEWTEYYRCKDGRFEKVL